MSVFGQAKDLIEMQKQAKKMKEEMSKIKVIGLSKNGLVKIHMNGAQELEHVTISEDAIDKGDAKKLAQSVQQAFKDATKKLQKEMMKGMDMDSLKGMMGG